MVGRMVHSKELGYGVIIGAYPGNPNLLVNFYESGLNLWCTTVDIDNANKRFVTILKEGDNQCK